MELRKCSFWPERIFVSWTFLCFGNEASRTRSVCLPIASPSCLPIASPSCLQNFPGRSIFLLAGLCFMQLQSHFISHVLLTSISYLCVPFLEMLFLAVHLHTHPSKTRTILTSTPPSRAPHPLPWCLPCPCVRSIIGTVWLVRDPLDWGS